MTNSLLPSAKGLSFTFNVESIFLFLLSPPKQSSSIDPGYHWSYCIVRLNMNLYIDFTVGSWSFLLKLTSSLFWFSNTFAMELLPLWINQICGSHFFHVFNVLFMKVLLEWFNLVIHCFLAINYKQLFCITSFTSYALHYYLDQDCVGCMSHQKLFCYDLPIRGRVGVKIGDADTCQMYL